MHVMCSKLRLLGKKFWGSFCHFPTPYVKREQLFVLAPFLPAPLQLHTHHNFRPLNCNQISGLWFRCSVVSFVSGKQEGTDRCESQNSSKSICFYWNPINCTQCPCLELVSIRNKKTEIRLIDFNLGKIYDKLENT